MVYCIRKLIPRIFQSAEKSFSLWRKPIIFTRRPLSRFHPFVRKQLIVFQPGKQRIKRSLYHDEPGSFQFQNNIRSIERPPCATAIRCNIQAFLCASEILHYQHSYPIVLCLTQIYVLYKYLVLHSTFILRILTEKSKKRKRKKQD